MAQHATSHYSISTYKTLGKNWYISVQKYDEEGNKTDLEKVYLNKGSTFVYGYDIEVEK